MQQHFTPGGPPLRTALQAVCPPFVDTRKTPPYRTNPVRRFFYARIRLRLLPQTENMPRAAAAATFVKQLTKYRIRCKIILYHVNPSDKALNGRPMPRHSIPRRGTAATCACVRSWSSRRSRSF